MSDQVESKRAMESQNSTPAMSILFQCLQLAGVSRTALLLRSLMLALLGICMMFRPAETIWVLTVAVGIIFLFDGTMLLLRGLKAADNLRALLVTLGVISLLLGLGSVLTPFFMDSVWVVVIGIWLLLSGVNYLFALGAVSGSARVLAILTGVLNLLAGLILVASPVAGLLTLTWLFGILFLASAISMGIFAFQLPKK